MSVQPDYASAAPSLAHAVEAVDPPIPMLILERGLRIRWVSSAAVKELGIRADRLIGRTWYDLFPESRARAAEHDQLFAGARASLEVPRIALELDCGRPKYFSLRLRPIRAADGSVEAILGVGEDITAQVLAELALRDNEERFHAISTHANDLIVIVNRGGVISFTSASLETVLGRRPNDRVGGSIFDHLHPEDLPRAQLAFLRLVDDPSATTPGGIELRKQRADGSWRWLQFTATNLLEHPQVRGIVFIGRDVTERKEAELALTQVQARLDAALWGARVAVYSTDLTCNRTNVSPQFFEISGIDPATCDPEQHPWMRHIHERDRGAVLERTAAHLAGKTDAVESEYRLRTPSGWMWVLDRARVMARDAEGRPRTLAGTVIDISARKDLEREMVEISSREQQRLSQDLHDGLGQELTGIPLFLSSIATRLKRFPSAACADDIDLVLSHLNNSIRNTRALAHGLHPAGADEGGLVGALTALADNMSLPGKVRVEFDASNWQPRRLPEDVASQIYRIGQEALGNAMRHAGGSCVLIRLAASSAALELVVRDNGRGLTDNARHAPGLGRKIMNSRAQMIGASIEWRTAAGGGTEVILQVPLPAASAS